MRRLGRRVILVLVAVGALVLTALLGLVFPLQHDEPGEVARKDVGVKRTESAKRSAARCVGMATSSLREKDRSSATSDDTTATDVLVEAFDGLVDAWHEPRAEGATLADAEMFRREFMKLPEDLRVEELDRALILVPDENAFIFAAILLDKNQPYELLDSILSDMLNRDDEVKSPFLKKIHEDQSHPCWEDVHWLLSDD